MNAAPVFVPSEALATLETPPARWLWDDYLHSGMVTLFTSRWKTGKTTLLSLLLSKLGGRFLGRPVAFRSAIVLSEESLALWQDRNSLLHFPAGIQFCARPFTRRPTPEQWSELLDELETAAPEVLILDPLAMFLPAHVENHAEALLDTLRLLHRLTNRGTAVLLAHHPKKSVRRGEFSPRGSGALTGFADILLQMDRPAEAESDRVRRLRSSSRLSPPKECLIELNADGDDYVVKPPAPDRHGFEGHWPLLSDVLSAFQHEPTRRQILNRWPSKNGKPSKNTLIRWLEEAERRGLVARLGTGLPRDAFTYVVKHQKPKPKETPNWPQ